MIHHSPAKSTTLLAILACVPLCLLPAGCQLVGALVAKAQGDPPIPALYVPQMVPTLILSEHTADAAVDDISSQDIGRRTADFWGDQKKLPPLIDLSKLEELRVKDPASYDKMSTAAIARALGAQQVLYIDVRDSHDETAGGSDTIRARAAARVKLINVATGQTLWPPSAADGYWLDAETDYQVRGEGVSESTQLEQVRAMLADKITKLFYAHPPTGYERAEPGNS